MLECRVNRGAQGRSLGDLSSPSAPMFLAEAAVRCGPVLGAPGNVLDDAFGRRGPGRLRPPWEAPTVMAGFWGPAMTSARIGRQLPG